MIACFLGAEIYLRHAMPDILLLAKIVKPSSDGILGYELATASETKFYGTKNKIPPSFIEISSQGLRDRVYELQKNPNVIRIAAMGDSFVFGLGVDSGDTIPKQLEILLNKNSSVGYEVMNCGVFGYNLAQEIRFLNKDILKFNPDIILFLITANDAERRIEIFSSKFSSMMFQYSYVYRKFCLYFDELSRKAEYQNKNFQQIIKVIEDPFRQIKQSISSNQKVCIILRKFSPWMKSISQISKDEGFLILDLSEMVARFHDSILINNDGHFNPQGSRFIASQIYSFLKEKILSN